MIQKCSEAIQKDVLAAHEKIFAGISVPIKNIKGKNYYNDEDIPEFHPSPKFFDNQLLEFPIDSIDILDGFKLVKNNKIDENELPSSKLDGIRRKISAQRKKILKIEYKHVHGKRKMKTSDWDVEDEKLDDLIQEYKVQLLKDSINQQKEMIKLMNHDVIKPIGKPTVEPVEFRRKERILKKMIENSASLTDKFVEENFSRIEFEAFRDKIQKLTSVPISIIAEMLDVDNGEDGSKEELFEAIVKFTFIWMEVLRDMKTHWPRDMFPRGKRLIDILICGKPYNRDKIKRLAFAQYTVRELRDFGRRIHLLTKHLTNILTHHQVEQIMTTLFPKYTNKATVSTHLEAPTENELVDDISDYMRLIKDKVLASRHFQSFLLEPEIAEVLPVEEKHMIQTIVFNLSVRSQINYLNLSLPFLKYFFHKLNGLERRMNERGEMVSIEEITVQLEDDLFILRLFFSLTRCFRYNFRNLLSREQYNNEFKFMFANRKDIQKNRAHWARKETNYIDKKKVEEYIEKNMKKPVNSDEKELSYTMKIRKKLIDDQFRREEMLLENLKFSVEDVDVAPLGDPIPNFPEPPHWMTLLQNASNAAENQAINAGDYVFRITDQTNLPYPWDVYKRTWLPDFHRKRLENNEKVLKKKKKKNINNNLNFELK